MTHPTAPPFTFTIRRGTVHDMVFQYVDVDTGEPYRFLSDPSGAWLGRMDVKNRAGDVVVRYHSTPGEGIAGVIAFDDAGHVTAHLPSTASEELPFQVDYRGRRVGNEQLFADLEIVDPQNNEPQTDWVGTGVIAQEVTANA